MSPNQIDWVKFNQTKKVWLNLPLTMIQKEMPKKNEACNEQLSMSIMGLFFSKFSLRGKQYL